MKAICKQCDQSYEITTGHYNEAIKKGRNFFCSRACSSDYQRRSHIELTRTYVRSLFDYRDGALYWKDHVYYGNIRDNRLAGYEAEDYWQVCLNNKTIHLHRIIFLWHYGWLPDNVDHEDRNKKNNYINNLRAADCSQNQANRNPLKNKVSEYLGVIRFSISRNLTKPWRASLNKNNKLYHSKYFSTEEEAALAYNKLAVFHHKEFSNLNIIKPKK